MFRCEDRGRLTEGEAWETPDPDEVNEALKVLCCWIGSQGFDAVWHQHLALATDIEERRRVRLHQRVMLGRYGREGMLEWDDREVTEIEEYARGLGQVISDENEARRIQEETG